MHGLIAFFGRGRSGRVSVLAIESPSVEMERVWGERATCGSEHGPLLQAQRMPHEIDLHRDVAAVPEPPARVQEGSGLALSAGS